MPKRSVHIRMSEGTKTKLDRLATRYSTQTEAIAIAIERLYQTERTTIMDDWRMDSDDRVVQIGWLNELAGNIAENLGQGTAEELVEYALSEDGRESWEIELPEWFDEIDRQYLVRRVFSYL